MHQLRRIDTRWLWVAGVAMGAAAGCNKGTKPSVGQPSAQEGGAGAGGDTSAGADAKARTSQRTRADANDETEQTQEPSTGPQMPVDLSASNLLPSEACKHPKVKAECADGLCRIPQGCFIMGARRDEVGAGRHSDVQVQVTLTHDFRVGQTEVTYAQWLAEGFEAPQRDILGGTADCREADCPVSNVSLFDAMTFANRYSTNRGLEPCYELHECVGTVGAGQKCRTPSPEEAYVCEGADDHLDCQGVSTTARSPYECTGYRLPTEAEWEYAARAGTSTTFWTGDIGADARNGVCSNEENLSPIAWYCANSDGHAHPVGQMAANPWGLHDVLGNVREWTTDVFNGLGYGDGPLVDPQGSWLTSAASQDLMPEQVHDGESARAHGFVTRGGAHMLPAIVNTASDRTAAMVPERGDTSIGLRLVRTLR